MVAGRALHLKEIMPWRELCVNRLTSVASVTQVCVRTNQPITELNSPGSDKVRSGELDFQITGTRACNHALFKRYWMPVDKYVFDQGRRLRTRSLTVDRVDGSYTCDGRKPYASFAAFPNRRIGGKIGFGVAQSIRSAIDRAMNRRYAPVCIVV